MTHYLGHSHLLRRKLRCPCPLHHSPVRVLYQSLSSSTMCLHQEQQVATTTLPLIGHLHGVARTGSFGIHYHMRRSVIFSTFSSLSILVKLVPRTGNNKSIVPRNWIQWIPCYTRPHFLR